MKRENQCPELAEWLQRFVRPGELVLDVGCGNKWYWEHLLDAGTRIVGIDAWESFHPSLVVDLEKDPWPFGAKSFDVVLVLDVIEHLSREAGKKVLEDAIFSAKRAVLVLTPLNWDDNSGAFEKEGDYQGNPFVLHKTLWTDADFPGFKKLEGIVGAPGRYFMGVYYV